MHQFKYLCSTNSQIWITNDSLRGNLLLVIRGSLFNNLLNYSEKQYSEHFNITCFAKAFISTISFKWIENFLSNKQKIIIRYTHECKYNQTQSQIHKLIILHKRSFAFQKIHSSTSDGNKHAFFHILESPHYNEK